MKPVAFGWYDLEIKRFFPHWDEDLMENKEGCIPLYTHPVKELTDRIAELENQLGFIASINRAGLGVVTATPVPSEKIEKIWNAIEEQKDDNFHYGWKKCEQYYGFTYPVKELTDEKIEKIEHKVYLNTIAKGKSLGCYSKELIKAILRKAQEK